MAFLLGQAPMAPCPICKLHPVALELVAGINHLATCARCGLPYAIRAPDGTEYNEALVAINPGFMPLFQRYWQEAGRKFGIPLYLVEPGTEFEPEMAARNDAMDDWMQSHQDLVAAAMAPMTWPYASVTVQVVEHPQGGVAWSVMAPPGGLAANPIIPFKPDGLPVGAVVTIQVPTHPIVVEG